MEQTTTCWRVAIEFVFESSLHWENSFGNNFSHCCFQLSVFVSISPIVGAIASGNTVALKPSELTPRFPSFYWLVVKSIGPRDIFVVNGAIPETTCLLEQKFDKIVYTGSGLVGTIIAKKAAETLTPVILELGGKSPAFVLDDISDKDLATVARRIAWGRFVNAGQTCIGVDYVLVAKSKHDKFILALQEVIEKSFSRRWQDEKLYPYDPWPGIWENGEYTQHYFW